jgi:hypothetical protein
MTPFYFFYLFELGASGFRSKIVSISQPIIYTVVRGVRDILSSQCRCPLHLIFGPFLPLADLGHWPL